MTTNQPVTITTTHEGGVTHTAPRPETETHDDTFRRARTLTYSPDVQAVRVERGDQIVKEYGPASINPLEGGIRPTLWHVLNIHTEHIHDAYANEARKAIESGNAAEAHQYMRRMDEAAQRYATYPQASKEAVADMDSVGFGIGAMYSAAFA
ncbi:hypothetical protein NE857_33775 (plasmid) [Nocardiopsis exhalans]|uniref:Uncharacterized protein n=1 Tax=Nocardiopsis exhalans TaxID=163604 RepID=A0ABY5DID2_9ACTN|nr:hypothetical protein [Nocardiopsis exhalans]USY23601.1 hypothetical protein NE857_33775 [Nocardiopsis exhalans]